MREIRGVAVEAGLPIHLDGARLWHACAETGSQPADYGSLADTVMVCLSKGLGAPVGSLLAGTKELMARAWRVRRRLGGGMRQSGFLAAAGIYALDHHRDRLIEDHAHARELARGAGEIPGVQVCAPETNIVMLDFPDPEVSLDGVLETLAAEGILMSRFGPSRLRAVTHLDVDDTGIARALKALAQAMGGPSRP
jgi:threonine aldolase